MAIWNRTQLIKSVRYLQNTIIKYVSPFFFLIPQNSDIFPGFL